ncbi:hypothetical protein KIN34_00660 [Cellulomonas sp. DKR-3]|uniref:Uncharacterized protein n=1 Tax=Cellulomonas fulva TaxID=2835530 RepID=A0ABS5TUJ1_9CELL|nr:hypothetical protein [Cellulomonas fulva]MBT0992802.1 hypothetical protein [Cellulomonas fulva]
MQPMTPQAFVRAFVAFLLGVVVGTIGTVVHRAVTPWGVVAAIGLVLATAVTMRAWAGWPAFVGVAGGVFLAVMVLTQTGPGGDVLVPSGDNVNDVWLGGVWLGGSMGALVLAALAPRRWFSDAPRSAPVPPSSVVPPDQP